MVVPVMTLLASASLLCSLEAFMVWVDALAGNAFRELGCICPFGICWTATLFDHLRSHFRQRIRRTDDFR